MWTRSWSANLGYHNYLSKFLFKSPRGQQVNFKSWAIREIWIKFERNNFQGNCYDWWLMYLLWNSLRWMSLNLTDDSLGYGLVPSGNKPLPEPMLTQICVTIWHHKVTMRKENFAWMCIIIWRETWIHCWVLWNLILMVHYLIRFQQNWYISEAFLSHCY